MSVSPEGNNDFLRLELSVEASDYDHYHPDFRDTIQQLNFVESYESQELHKMCILDEYKEEPHYTYWLLYYTRFNYEGFDNSTITLDDTYHMEHIYGISLSIADIHYQSGHYASCLLELGRIESAMQFTNHELIEDIQYLRQHCQNFLTDIDQDGRRTDVGCHYFPRFT